jgi:hypothetical protein
MGFDINQQSPTYYFYDDSEGNIFYSEFAYNNIDPGPVGNIIYEHGLIILTQPVNNDLTLFQIPFTNDVSCSFESTVTIYETQYKCTIRENEFNFSNNPSLLQGSLFESFSNAFSNAFSQMSLNISSSFFSSPGNGKLNNNVTGSYFSPYITTVGLYNNNKELLAVAKLAQPLPVSSVTDTSILINFDF